MSIPSSRAPSYIEKRWPPESVKSFETPAWRSRLARSRPPWTAVPCSEDPASVAIREAGYRSAAAWAEVPGVGFEPTRPIGTRAFKAPMSTRSITRAGTRSLGAPTSAGRRSEEAVQGSRRNFPAARLSSALRGLGALSMEAGALNPGAGVIPGIAGRSPLLRLQSDERLIALIRRGQHGAFEVLVQRYQSRLLSFCRHMLGSTEDAEDVLQEVFAAAYNAILGDERAINARPWLYRIARNRCLNHLRRPRSEEHTSELQSRQNL